MGVQLKIELTRTTLTCRRCGEKGTAEWEGVAGEPQSVLISLDGFYERLAAKKPHAIELVCHRCGEVQRDWAGGRRKRRQKTPGFLDFPQYGWLAGTFRNRHSHFCKKIAEQFQPLTR